MFYGVRNGIMAQLDYQQYYFAVLIDFKLMLLFYTH